MSAVERTPSLLSRAFASLRYAASASGFDTPFESGKTCCGSDWVRLGKADVVELHFAEAQLHQLFGDADVVVPQLVVIRIHPREALLVAPDASRPGLRIVHSGCTRAVTESLNTTMRAIGRILCAFSVSSSAVTIAASSPLPGVLRELRIRRLVVQPELVLHVDDERVDLRRSAIGDQLRMRFVLCAAQRFT